MKNRFALSLILLTGIAALVLSTSAFAASGKIQGKVWVVSHDQAANVTFPAPTAIPDITFSTNYIAYLGGWPKGEAPSAHCFNISKFLGGCAQEAFDLKYSNLPNPYLGNTPVNAKTPMGGANYGVIMEFTYTETNSSAHTAQMTIYHDDGIAMEVNGGFISGFFPTTTWPIMESVQVAITPGTTTYDLLYGNVGGKGDGASLVYYSVFVN